MVNNLSKAFDFSVRILAIVSWISAVAFGLYILAFYFTSFILGDLDNWNLGILPGLYDSQNTKSTFGMGLHFAAGGLILVLGSIQLVERIRINYPLWHRWIGRIYIISSLATAIGGLFFIFFKGTVGGLSMDIGFGLYGFLMFISSIMTWKHAVKGDFSKHRRWALRLFVLAIGSWLYRIESALARIILGDFGHTNDFHGVVDMILNFFFYVPNLIILEIYLTRKWQIKNKISYFIFIILIWSFIFSIAFASYFLVIEWWIPNLKKSIG
ncbi:MAG: hypothetical protein RI983_1372 [Bacteroidota bacterium]|jgi:uncharacterized membrane protein